MSEPRYKVISVNPDFREFILDLIERMGLSAEHIELLFPTNPALSERRNTNFGEFAKCFVSKYMDARYNYEVYELAGDACINNSVIMFLLKQILAAQHQAKEIDPSFVPSIHLTDYYNKIKAVYISAKEYHDIATRLGFDQFLEIGRIPQNKESELDKILTDCFEAFIGCFELLGDRYLDSHYSHQYVTNFVNYIFTMRKINYQPSNCYDVITLFKETNDILRKRFTCEYKIMPYEASSRLFFISDTSARSKPDIVTKFTTATNNNAKMSEDALEYLRDMLLGKNSGKTIEDTDPDAILYKDVVFPVFKPQRRDKQTSLPFSLKDIKTPPTAKELGIESLL
jgi:dsRNA-specific ribonuclease